MSDHLLRLMTVSDLELVLAWRNHPDVSNNMFTRHEISIEEHRLWYQHAKSNPSVDLMIYEENGEAHGFVNIARMRCSQIANWGFFMAPNSPKGSGHELGKLSLNYGFSKLGLQKICGQVIEFNEGSIAFHKRFGFTEEGRLRKQHFDGHRFYDVLCFGLLVNEYENANQGLNNEQT